MRPEETFFSLIGQALGLQARAFESLEALPDGSETALLVILLAGFSTALGQSAVLFANRVKPGRFTVSLLASALVHTLIYLFWTLSIYALARLLFGVTSLGTVARAVGLGYAPQLFNFLVFMPFFGVPVQILLSLWSLLAILVGIDAVSPLLPWQALVCSILGWFVLQVFERTLGRLTLAARRWLRRRITGVDLIVDTGELETWLEGDVLDGLETYREIDEKKQRSERG